ncbi:MAG TPA: acyl-CoA dehydrogenase family protein [Chloroflexota bacterium]|nr:acyl-CoA dehydrogenase family protein [Chloroflexota bacterium]
MTIVEGRQSALERPDDLAAIVELAARVGREVLAPRAAETDVGAAPPRENFAALVQAGLMGLSIPVRYGGLEADSSTCLEVLETLSRSCAATAFLFTQHMGVCGSIAAGGSALAPIMLPRLATGELLVGIGASQLRRAGSPQLRARRTDGGFFIDGSVPWASGYGLMTHLVLGATNEDGLPMFFWVPFVPAEGISFGPVQDMVVMRAASTVPVRCEGLFVADEAVIGDDQEGYWRSQHGGTLGNPMAFLLGIGAGCLDGLRAAAERDTDGFVLRSRLEALEAEWTVHRHRFYSLTHRFVEGDRGETVLDALLATRVVVSAFVLRLAQIAIAAEGGRAHLRGNPAQRRLREASFFLTATVNRSVREALVQGL